MSSGALAGKLPFFKSRAMGRAMGSQFDEQERRVDRRE
jgi:hypothetical protein